MTRREDRRTPSIAGQLRTRKPIESSKPLHILLRHSPFAIRHSPFAIRHSPFAIRHSPFDPLLALRPSPFAIRHSIHFWPFDGWTPPPGRSVIAEIYPALWSRTWPAGDRDSHQHDAWSSARWMRERDADGTLVDWWNPRLSETEAVIAGVEGWILGLA